MNNKLIKTDGILYKIRRFFKSLFKVKTDKKEAEYNNESKTNFNETISYRKEVEEYQKKERIAQNLLDGKIDVEELQEAEVEEMIEYFKKDIEKQEQELQRIRLHILEMKKELQENKK